ncbi:MAG: hypothetical protein WBG86_01650, partial [Polyangiales bacterium]
MSFPATRCALVASVLLSALPVSVFADSYSGSDGYVRDTNEVLGTDDPGTYVVIDESEGTVEEIEGEQVIVVQEPEPAAASNLAPPDPQTVVVEQPAPPYDGAIWVDGYWAYEDGQYVWVEGHYVAPRQGYVFVHPRWDYYSDIYYFVPGYYRPCSVWVSFGYYRPFFFYGPYFASFYYRAPFYYPRYYGPRGGHGRYYGHRGFRGGARAPYRGRGYPTRRPVARDVGRPGRVGSPPLRGTPGARPVARGARPTPTVPRTRATQGRTRPASRIIPSPTRTVNRSPSPAPTAAVNRTPLRPARTNVVARTRPTGTRATPTTRPQPNVSRTRTVGRARPDSPRTSVVSRPPRANTPTVVRGPTPR